ncbi:aldo/keto reductase [Sunxiuqinia dokdonensis]|uniref:NADP-dependent oxidoreductase domain-containing protein n=1 Tax=Sunxiuqinia dokdonensis TaxID=1409788 RepID=A0A0L8V7D8_9BACT|nr:aldo/keto reductase [Sunxiuqinia dokdonensis]KOH44117.1 hypothetical protein NC99_31100 [Sunxiuqinia dokdonensis]
MKKINRREFVRKGIAGVSAVSAGLAFTGFAGPADGTIGQVKLGETGLNVSQLAFGCGTNGWAHESVLTRGGMDAFKKVSRHAYDRGVTFIDTADSYGTHTFVRELFKEVPRDNFQLMTKIWTEDNNWNKVVPVQQTLDRFKKELGAEYFDIVLLHCLMNGNWVTEKASFREQLSEAKQKGEVKLVGVSCHNIDAMKAAVVDPWVDVILARINPDQVRMDGTPEEIMKLLKTAKDAGKGVIGMKIFGGGNLTQEEVREKSLRFAWESGNVHTMTIGMEKTAYVDDAVERIARITKDISG